MATPLLEYLLNEAASGTTPTTIANSGSAPSSALTLTYGAGNAWTSNNGGRALQVSSTGVSAVNTSVDSAVNTGLSSSKTASLIWQHSIGTLQTSGNQGIFGVFKVSPEVDTIGADFGVVASAGYRFFTQTVADGFQEPAAVELTATLGDHVIAFVLDTAATNRRTIYRDGFAVVANNTGITSNTTLDTGGGPLEVYLINDGGGGSGASTFGYAALHSVALTASEVLRQTLRLFASNDASPTVTTGANLQAASTNGGTDDASTSTSDHTVAPTQTVGVSGQNRALFGVVTGVGVSAGVSGTPTFNGTNGTKITSILSSTNCVEVWMWNDAALPAAGTYSASATVDGASGTAAMTLFYFEGVSQSAPTNFGTQTGTGTSLTVNMTSSPAAGSILLAGLLDITTTDTPTHGANQLPTSSVNGTSTGNTHKHATSAKYVPSAGANSMSWTTLTNTSAKVGLAIEVPVFTAGGGPSVPKRRALLGVGA